MNTMTAKSPSAYSILNPRRPRLNYKGQIVRMVNQNSNVGGISVADMESLAAEGVIEIHEIVYPYSLAIDFGQADVIYSVKS